MTTTTNSSNVAGTTKIALSQLSTKAPLAVLKPYTDAFRHAWEWIQSKRVARASQRHLQIMETVSLGDKRIIALIQVDGERFLIGGCAAAVSLLSRIEPIDSFKQILRNTQCAHEPSGARAIGNTLPAIKVAKRRQPASQPVNDEPTRGKAVSRKKARTA